MKLPVYAIDMKDDCLLGNNFLSAVNFEETFASFLGIPSQKEKENSFCFRIMREIEGTTTFKGAFWEKDTEDLNKEWIVQFLTEFQDVFSEEIIAGIVT